jgi:hypothetical protein
MRHLPDEGGGLVQNRAMCEDKCPYAPLPQKGQDLGNSDKGNLEDAQL